MIVVTDNPKGPTQFDPGDYGIEPQPAPGSGQGGGFFGPVVTTGRDIAGSTSGTERDLNKKFRQEQDARSGPTSPYDDSRKAQLEAERQRRLNELGFQEAFARDMLESSTKEAANAIDLQLLEMTKELGYNAGLARQQEAGQAAAKGLLRSSFGNRAIGDVTQRELQQQNILQGQAAQQKVDVSEATRKMLNDISTRRQQMADELNQAELNQIDEIRSSFDLNDIQMQMEQQIAAIEQNAANRSAMMGMIGGLIGNLATIGMVGAM